MKTAWIVAAVAALAITATPNAFASRFHVKHHVRSGLHHMHVKMEHGMQHARVKMHHGHMHMHNLVHHGHM